MRILVTRNGEQLGPFSEAELQAAVQAGTFQMSDLAWVEGTPSWEPISTILPALAAAGPPPLRSAPPQPFAFPQTGPQAEGLATASLILGILSLICFSILTGIPAILCGHVARSRIKASPARFTGAGMALVGLILGYLSVAMIPIGFAAVMPAVQAERLRAKENTALADARVIALACRQHAETHGGIYPASLDELIPGEIALRATIEPPSPGAAGSAGFDYLLAGKLNPGADEVLIVSKGSNRLGEKVVARVSGEARMEHFDPPPPTR